MTAEKPEPTTQELLANVAEARVRVAADVERLATQLAPAQLKERALDVAQDSAQSLAARALRGLVDSPRRLVSYARKHPMTGAAVLAGTALVVWRIAAGRARRA